MLMPTYAKELENSVISSIVGAQTFDMEAVEAMASQSKDLEALEPTKNTKLGKAKVKRKKPTSVVKKATAKSDVNKSKIDVKGIQYETDSVYEGKDNIIIMEAKNSKTSETAIRQLYYPYRAIKKETNTKKKITCLFFEKRDNIYNFWFFDFKDENKFNSIELTKSVNYTIE